MTEEQKAPEDSPVKSLSITPAITALLKPTAEYLGLELRDYVKASVEEWKAKRRERNLNAHLEAVREKLAKEPPTKAQSGPSFNQLMLFDEWIEKAQDIDPEDKDLSDIWRNLLAKAARGEPVPTEVVAALKSLSPREAQFLVEMEQRTPPRPFLSGVVSAESRYLATSLQAKGILEKDYTFSVLLLSSLGVSGVLAYYIFERMNLLTAARIQSDMPLAGLAIAATIIMFAALGSRLGLARWRRTWLGRELLEFVTSRSPRLSADDAQQGAQADSPASGGPAASSNVI